MSIKGNIVAAGMSLALVGATGCLGGGIDPMEPTGVPGDGTATGAVMQFGAVTSILQAKCTGGNCHDTGGGPQFLGSPGADDNYMAIKQNANLLGNNDAAASRLVQKIEEGDHYGITYTPGERQAIQAWLDAEKMVQGGGGGNPGAPGGGIPGLGGGGMATVSPGLAGFATCLTLADLTTPVVNVNGQGIALDDITNYRTNDNNNNNQQCAQCHENGNNGNIMMTDDAGMLILLKGANTQGAASSAGVQAWWREEIQNGQKTVVFAREKWERLGDGLQQNNNRTATGHPRYGNGANNTFTQVFMQVTQTVAARQATGACQQ